MKISCNFTLYLLLGMFSVNCNKVAPQQKPAEEPSGSTALRYVASPQVSAAADNLEKIQKLFREESHSMTSIGERQKELGFESLNIAFDSGSTKYKRLEPAIREFESFVNGLSVTSTIKDKAREVLAHLKLDDIEEASRQGVTFSFASPSTGGSIDISYFKIFEHAPTRWTVQTMSVKGTFKTMPDWYLETTHSSKSRFLSSSTSTTQRIVYVPRGVTQQDMMDLLCVVIPNYSGMNLNLLSGPFDDANGKAIKGEL